MPKARTLAQQAADWVDTYGGPSDGRPYEIDAFIAGHRANRLTKAERAVVEAAKLCHARDFRDGVGALVKAVSALERKGRK